MLENIFVVFAFIVSVSGMFDACTLVDFIVSFIIFCCCIVFILLKLD